MRATYPSRPTTRASMSKGQGAASAAPALSDLELDRQIHAEIAAAEEGHRSALGHAIRAGELLTEKKSRLVHGEWMHWMEDNFPGHYNTAGNYMKLAANSQRVVNLGSVREALAVLRSPKKAKKKTKPAASTLKGKAGLSHDPDVVAWVRAKYEKGWNRDQIVAASESDSSGWPRPGESLTNGGVSECRAAIVALDHAKANGSQLKPRTSEAGSRRHEATRKRAQARRDGLIYGYFWDTCVELAKATSYLEAIGLDLDHLALDEHSLLTVSDLLEDLARLQVFQNNVYDAVQNKLGENNVRERIRKLREKTVANGCTAEEAYLSQQKADVLEQNLRHKLAS